jgi:hypothetical protein
MSGNSLLTISMITKESTRILKNNLGFAKSISRQYDDSFAQSGAKIGSVINIRKPSRFTAVTGPALQIQDVQDQSVALTLTTQAHVDFQFSSKDLTLSVDEFSARYCKPAVNTLVNKVDYDGLTLVNNSVFNAVGTPGTTPNTALIWLQAGQKLDENACPRDGLRTICMNPAAQASTLDALKGLFQSGEKIKEQYESGKMGEGLGFDWKMDQNIQPHTVGALGTTPITTSTGSPQTGASITMQGGSNTITGYFTAGDVITFAGVYAVNPVSFQTTGSLKQFLVTANVATNGSGVATIPISPAIVTSGPYQNVSNAPATSSAILTFGAVSTTGGIVTPNNVCFHRDAFVLGMADLDVPRGVDMASRVSDPDSGISLRMVRAFDIVNDIFPTRMDILYGYQAIYPEWACRVQG